MELKDFIRFSPERYVVQILHDSEKARVVLFCLEAGQRVEPHVSASEVFIYVVEGKGRFLLGDEAPEAKPGTLIACKGNQPHGFSAEERMVLLAIIAPRPS